MTKRNPSFARLQGGYIFPEVNARKRKFLEKNPNADIISLSIGDTTEPIPKSIADALMQASAQLGTSAGYIGYGPEHGFKALREKIASKLYSGIVKADEIIVSDGAKCDLGRLQMLFGAQVSIAVQDPAYPVYRDGSIINGVQEIVHMPCTPENDFFPDLAALPRTDLIYICSPNNPTGAVASESQLKQLVAHARKNKSIIIFDSAYASYNRDPNHPKSIYEIDGAREVSIEISSFSKLAGFTGVRLGWTIVPEELKYEDGASVRNDWTRLMNTVFNGASVISQHGGEAVLDDKGLEGARQITDYYLENSRIMIEAFKKLGYEVFGGVNAPYLWVRIKGRKSWDIFQEFLERFHIVGTPGSGFGPSGEGFIRFTAFGHRQNILRAVERLHK